MRSIVLSCVASALATSAAAASINIDFGVANPPPAPTYGAAASTPGFWNIFNGAPTPLLDLSASPTGASLSMVGTGFLGGFNDPLTLGNDDLLLDDFIAIPVTDIYTVTGLPAGTYDVYVYTWTFGPLSTGITVNSQPMQVIGGTWPGFHALGASYSLDTVTLAANQPLIIRADSIGGALGAVSGIQIVEVPAPGAGAAMLALAAVTARRRR